MTIVTKADLDAALARWKEARETAAAEQLAWADVIGSHESLINSLMKHGHSWEDAEAAFDRVSNDHRARIEGAWKAMDQRCAEYHELRVQHLRGQ